MATIVTGFAVVVVIALAIARSAGRPVRIDNWAVRRSLHQTAENRPIIARYLRRTRSLRWAGGLAGFLLVYLPQASVTLTRLDGDNGIYLSRISTAIPGGVAVMAGYLLGAIAAELSLRRRQPGELQVAALQPRRVGDYTARWAKWALRVSVVAVALMLPLRLLSTRAPGSDGFALVTYVQLGLAAVALLVLVEALARLIVRRPQPYADTHRITADDATRSCSIHALVGSALGINLLTVGYELADIGAGDVSEWGTMVALGGFLVGFPVSLTAWFVLGTDFEFRPDNHGTDLRLRRELERVGVPR